MKYMNISTNVYRTGSWARFSATDKAFCQEMKLDRTWAQFYHFGKIKIKNSAIFRCLFYLAKFEPTLANIEYYLAN